MRKTTDFEHFYLSNPELPVNCKILRPFIAKFYKPDGVPSVSFKEMSCYEGEFFS
jgi:hypothetical protein